MTKYECLLFGKPFNAKNYTINGLYIFVIHVTENYIVF